MDGAAKTPPEGVTPHRAGLANLLLAVVSLTVFFGIAEIATRVVDLRPSGGQATANAPWLGNRWLLPRRDYREKLAETGFLSRYYDLYTWDRFLFYRLRAHRELELIDPMAPDDVRDLTRWSVQTGPDGFRGGAISERPPAGRTRILTLGDSSTFGWGVEAFETYAARLPDALARHGPGGPDLYDVHNLGVPGYSTFQGRVLLERHALPLAPDLVTWSFLSNDGAATGERDAATYARREGMTGALLAVLHRSRAFETLSAWIASLRARVAPAATVDPRDPAARNVASQDEALSNAVAAVRTAQTARIPIVLLGLCVRPPVSTTLARAADATGVPFFDATKLLDDAIPRIATDDSFRKDRVNLVRRYGAQRLNEQPYLLAYLPDGCHPNAVGHRLVADALAEQILPLLPEDGA